MATRTVSAPKPKPLDMSDERIQRAIDMTFAGRYTQEQIAASCHIAPRTYRYWRDHAEFQAVLAEKRADFKRSIEAVTFADKARRIHALNDAALLAINELEARPLLKEIRPTKDGEIVNEAFNNAAMAEFRAALDDIAKELGERSNSLKMEHSGEQTLTVRYVNDWRGAATVRVLEEAPDAAQGD